MLSSAVAKWLSTRKALRRRRDVPAWFFVVVATHVALGACMIAYPLAVDSRYDGFFVLALVAIAAHWSLLRGECALSVLEKRAFYDGYEIGSMPMHQWYMDVFSPTTCVAIAVMIGCTWLFALGAIAYRNRRHATPAVSAAVVVVAAAVVAAGRREDFSSDDVVGLADRMMAMRTVQHSDDDAAADAEPETYEVDAVLGGMALGLYKHSRPAFDALVAKYDSKAYDLASLRAALAPFCAPTT